MEVAVNVGHVGLLGGADSTNADALSVALQQDGLAVERCPLETAPVGGETATVIVVDEGDLGGLERALRQRSTQPVLVLTSSTALASRVAPMLRVAHDLGSVTDPPGLIRWRLARLIERSRGAVPTAGQVDVLTGLVLRQVFEPELVRASEFAGPGRVAGFVHLDLDLFKTINERLGHGVGDAVLRRIAENLRHRLMPRDIVARLGGDEFGWLLVREDEETVVRDACDLVSRFGRFDIPELRSEPDLRLSASAGLTFLRPGAESETLLSEGDVAAYEAKSAGRNRLVVYQQMAEQSRRARKDIEVRHFENVARVAAERMIGAITMKSRSLIEAAQREAHIDSLTGLYRDRRYIVERLAHEMAMARSRGRPLSLVMLDLDHFGEINKTFGWPTGDRVLQAFAAIVKDHLGPTHWAARYGGEEFLIVMPDATLADATRLAESLRAALTTSPVDSLDGRVVRATLSAGVTQLEDGCASVEALVDEASSVLLRAKEGRNRVETRTPVSTTETDSDPFDLRRFVRAQSGGTYEVALEELRRGRKDSHWMWFVFPQLKGLGQSTTAHRFGITGLGEARAYLAHPLLGPRLRECVRVLLDLDESCGTALDIFGGIDAMKLRSSLTLFAAADAPNSDFQRLLDKYCYGERDELTVAMLLMKGSA